MPTDEENNINSVINSGASEIQIDGQTAKYRPLSDLERIERSCFLNVKSSWEVLAAGRWETDWDIDI